VPGLFAQDYARQAGYSAAFDLVIAPGGKLVLVGAATNGDPAAPEGSDAIALRLTSRGRPDSSFSGDGIAYLPATESKDTFNRTEPFPGAYGVVSNGGALVLAGFNDTFGLKQLAVWALNGRGRAVGRFGSRGHTFTQLQRGDNAAASALLSDVAVTRDGRRLYGVGDIEAAFGDPPRGIAVRYGGLRR